MPGRTMLSKVPAPPLPAILTALRSSSLGQPVVTNGLPLSKIHHGAFDPKLIGIDPDFRIHLSEGCSNCTMASPSNSGSKRWPVH
jgi:putative restriction endonuclease